MIGSQQISGNINIGTNSSRTGTITLGANSCPISVGGVMTCTQGLTLSAGKYITTTAGSGTPSTNQIGALITGVSINNGTTMTSGSFYSVFGPITLPAGSSWIITAGCQITSAGSVSLLTGGFSTVNRTTGSSSATAYLQDATVSISNPTGSQQILMNYVYQTTSGATVYFNLTSTNSGAPTIASTSYGFIRAIKIA